MKKQCLIDRKNHEIICACSPTVPNEVSRWYNEGHDISIASYGKLINNVVNCVGSNDIKLISCFTFYDRPNLLTQKKGMKGVFSKFPTISEKLAVRHLPKNMYFSNIYRPTHTIIYDTAHK